LLRASVQEALADLEAADRGGDRDSLHATIVFVDLASFTPLAQIHGDEVAAEVLDRFDELVRELLERHTGTLVKQIGDAFMLTFADPLVATRFVVDLDDAAVREPNFPAIRAGINAGRVLYRVGDYVGHTVNVASRIAAIAKAHEILITEPVAKAAEAGGIPLEHAGERRLAGVEEPVALWHVAREGERATYRELDPVCGMAVGTDAAAHVSYGGFEYAFCSHACLRRFLEDPTRYAEPAEVAKPEL
jgi:class 3 adenylate cyclase/YHS domain-containing protein